MPKIKLLLASILLVFAVGAITAASAAAEEEKPEFVVEGLTEGGTEQVAEESTKFIKSLVLEASEEPKIECSKDKIVGETIKDDSADDTIKALDFEGCTDKSEEKACKVPSGDIDTTELEVELESGKNEKDTDEKFKPVKSNEIAHFKLEGSECKETKELKIDGDFISKEEDNEEKAEGALPVNVEVEASSGELEYGDQLRDASFRLELLLHAPLRFGLCRHPHQLMILCLY
jgi:hypothetical protein